MYCDFVLWTENDLHIERIYPDEEFWHRNVTDYAQPFFTTAILPELIGKFYSRIGHEQTATPEIQSSLPSTSVLPPDETSETFCYCHGPDEGAMVGCDNPTCQHGSWFHLKCVGLKSKPKSKYWHCPDCRKLPNFQRRNRKKGTNL